MTTAPPVAASVTLPALGENVDEGTITRWLKQPGDWVGAGEPLLEVATDKVDTEIPSPVAGTLDRVLAEEGEVVPVGAPLAVVVSPAESGGRDETTPAPAPEPGRSAMASSPETPATAASSTTEKLTRVRRTIARRMVESLSVSAQLTTVVEVDVTAIDRLRRAHKDEFLRRTGVKLSFLPFFTKAAVDALAEHRVINSALNADATEVTYFGPCHLGMAVDSERGLLVPVVRDAHTLGVAGLALAIADKAERVRTGRIGADELSGGTFTLTNTGSRGALFDTPIINQPQSAILGVGAVVERLVPARDSGGLRIDVRSMAYLSLSYDHRIVDGADAARFLGAVRVNLETGFAAADLV